MAVATGSLGGRRVASVAVAEQPDLVKGFGKGTWLSVFDRAILGCDIDLDPLPQDGPAFVGYTRTQSEVGDPRAR